MDEIKTAEENLPAEDHLQETDPAETSASGAEDRIPDPLESDPGEPYVERPRSQRIFAWVLTGIMILGVILYYYWIAKG